MQCAGLVNKPDRHALFHHGVAAQKYALTAQVVWRLLRESFFAVSDGVQQNCMTCGDDLCHV